MDREDREEEQARQRVVLYGRCRAEVVEDRTEGDLLGVVNLGPVEDFLRLRDYDQVMRLDAALAALKQRILDHLWPKKNLR